MKIAYVTNYNALDIRKWSGLGYYIAKALEKQSISIEYIGPLADNSTFFLNLKQRVYRKLFNKIHLLDREPAILKDYAKQISAKLNYINPDIVFSPGTIPISYLECKQPIVFWTDCTFGAMVDFYHEFSKLTKRSIINGNQMEQHALERCSLALYASEWAAKTAAIYYQVNSSKIKVIPFGVNLENERTFEEIKNIINARPRNKCKLLFLGVDWQRKGGDIAFKVVKELNKQGLKAELTIVGCNPKIKNPSQDNIKVIGNISKTTIEGREKINKLIAESHLLIIPSRAEAFGVAFCEANSLGVPCLGTAIGGITTIIKNGINGQLFSLDDQISTYCTYITNLFTNYSLYKDLAYNAFIEYKKRLNWFSAGKIAKKYLMELIAHDVVLPDASKILQNNLTDNQLNKDNLKTEVPI